MLGLPYKRFPQVRFYTSRRIACEDFHERPGRSERVTNGREVAMSERKASPAAAEQSEREAL